MFAVEAGQVPGIQRSCRLRRFARHSQLAALALFANDVAVTSLCAM